MLTRDRGKKWVKIKGLPSTGRPYPDRFDSKRFYAVSFDKSAIYLSTNGGISFKAQKTTGLPVRH